MSTTSRSDGHDRGELRPAARISHYRIIEKLGEGGMGVVYAAEDERLGRRVALKVIRGELANEEGRARLIREARVLASVSHPMICQVFELGEWNGQPFLALELLSGQSLSARIAAGALPPHEALRTATAMARGLSALHQHGIVHRDLKPSNIFLTSLGVKLLDFGLARPLMTADAETTAGVTGAGLVVGTPQYSSPEQLLGSEIDARSDIFSAGVIAYEMLAGRPPFVGATFAALVHAVLHDPPPVLTGSLAMTAVDRVLCRALAKKPDERYPAADALASDLNAVLALIDHDEMPEARAMFRLAVLPFRMLNPDPEYGYLGQSLADALIDALAGLESLVVRSGLKTARYANAMPDPEVLASELAVDVVLSGSILRSGGRLRVSAQLASVPAGDTLWTETSHITTDDIFDLHDDLAKRVVTSLPLTSRDRAAGRPRSRPTTQAYECYLRGMQLRMETGSWRQARALFERSLEIDPAFAPAWAELGRLDRVLGKYENPLLMAHAETAFRRALALEPDNGAAHHYYAQLEMDLGRHEAVLRRLLDRLRQRRAEPHVYAALVQACRYCGLLDESLAADAQARRLDPTIASSVLHTYYMRNEYARVLDHVHESSDPIEARALGALGRDAEAISAAGREEQRFAAFPLLCSFSAGMRAALEGKIDAAIAALRPLTTEAGFNDGEGLFYVAEIYAKMGLSEDAMALLHRAVDAGFRCLHAFEKDPYLEPLRRSGALRTLLDRVRTERELIVSQFVQSGGRGLLGLQP